MRSIRSIINIMYIIISNKTQKGITREQAFQKMQAAMRKGKLISRDFRYETNPT